MQFLLLVVLGPNPLFQPLLGQHLPCVLAHVPTTGYVLRSYDDTLAKPLGDGQLQSCAILNYLQTKDEKL